jgi:DNA mismatch repair protein MutL
VERIQRLPDDLVNKIAAGEVVERPASVVKELVENSLDADAHAIVVEVAKGGKDLIRVRDDGLGMGREDAARSIERHATSKLHILADLERVATHGFRGEALPSIASVSRLTLTTRDTDSPAATEILVLHGELVHVRDAGHPRGTTVEVAELFGAVPARRKFLRADSTESGHIAEVVTSAAVAHPTVSFQLRSGARVLLECPAADGLSSRLYQIFGGAHLEDLASVDGALSWVRVTGFVSRPEAATALRPTLHLYVNGRAVRDRGIMRAVIESYRAAGLARANPEAFLFVEVPLDKVDVNVHPAKTEVRFADGRTVWMAVTRAVQQAISSAAHNSVPRADTSLLGEPSFALVRDAWAGAMPGPEAAQNRLPLVAPSSTALVPRPPIQSAASVDARPQEENALVVLGQHRSTYIVASDGNDLLLVDQHTAHERVRFETIMRAVSQGAPPAQLLLAPVVVELAPRLRAVAEERLDILQSLGFDLEPFGAGALRLASVPAPLAGRDPQPTLEHLLADLLEREEADWQVSTAQERAAATVACHSAARAGDPLGHAAMAAIVRDLGLTEHPSLCPHGRPTVVRIPREDVARWFGRKGWRRE